MTTRFLTLPIRTHAQAVEDAHDQRRHRRVMCGDCETTALRTSQEFSQGLCWSCSRERAGNGSGTGQREDTGYE